MANTVLTLKSERWLDQVLLQGTSADAAIADYGETFSLPVGLGDVALMELYVECIALTAIPALAIPWMGVRAGIFSQDLATLVDIVGVQPWYRTLTATAAAAYFSPDPLVLWRQGEVLHLKGPDMDTGAAGDLFVAAKVVRVRAPAEGVAAPVQLVR